MYKVMNFCKNRKAAMTVSFSQRDGYDILSYDSTKEQGSHG